MVTRCTFLFAAALKWLALLTIDLAANIIGYLLAPLVVLFANGCGWLPKWLRWFGTNDNDLDGDRGWIHEHWQWRYRLPPRFSRYVGRVGWLWRNNAYAFAEDVLGFEIKDGFDLSIIGDARVSNRPLMQGLVIRKLTQGGKLYWQWYYVKAWSATNCIRINLGWKMWGDIKVGDNCQFVCSFNPLLRIEESLSAAHLRLASGTNIENLPWQECIRRYDRAHTFFYMDPPYWQTEGYGVPFEWSEYQQIAAVMRTCKGRAMLSINDHPDIRREFDGLTFHEIGIKYSVAAVHGKPEESRELVITNYEPTVMGVLF